MKVIINNTAEIPAHHTAIFPLLVGGVPAIRPFCPFIINKIFRRIEDLAMIIIIHKPDGNENKRLFLPFKIHRMPVQMDR